MTDVQAGEQALVTRLDADVEQVALHYRRNQLSLYQPYPKQYEFHIAGARCRERLMMSGSQLGKTWSASMELAMHLTGVYPDWWPGIKYDRPITAWVGAATNELSREVIQVALLGTESADPNDEDWGTGAIPAGRIVGKPSKRQSNVTDVIDVIKVRWRDTKKTSRVNLKTFDQGREKWQGKKVDFVWLDEQEESIYSEALTRTNAVKDGRLMQTFTPLKGLTPIIESFLAPDVADPGKSYTNMTIWDAVGGVWPGGTPWAGEPWEGHYDRDEVDAIVARYPAHERDARSKGIPMVGEGRVYPIAEESIQYIPFEIPRHFARIVGHDFGSDHPAASVWLAHDRSQDIIYLYDCYKEVHPTFAYHAFTLKRHGEWIPVAWPHDGINRDKRDSIRLRDMYAEICSNMLSYSARYQRDKGGAQDSGPAILDVIDRMITGRFKVAAHLTQWFDEFRFWHRKNGLIVAYKDDLMKATLYAMMMLNHAITEPVKRRHRPAFDAPIIGRMSHAAN
jgi:phage terminase large subunit-like protein